MAAREIIRSAWHKDAVSLRASLIALMLLGTLLPLLVVGFGFSLLGIPAILDEEREHALAEADALVRHVELALEGVEGRMAQLVPVVDKGASEIQRHLDTAVAEGGFQAIYLVDRSGRIIHLALPGDLAGAEANVRGADLSRTPLYRLGRDAETRVWGDRYLSPVTGQATVGLALPAGRYLLLGEMRPGFADEIVELAAREMREPVFIIDRAGEMVASRFLAESERLRNWAPQLKRADSRVGDPVVRVRIGDASFEAALAQSARLGWTMVVASPAGMANPRLRGALVTLVSAIAASLLVAAVLAPLWASRLNAPLSALIRRTGELAKGHFAGDPVRGHISEFNELSTDMESMAAAIQQRQRELEISEEKLRATLQTIEQLNADLERRVEQRTAELARSNRELAETVASLNEARDELSRSERLAALGKLFVRVADELERPVGSGVMSLAMLRDELLRLRREQAQGGNAALAHALARLEEDAGVAQQSLVRTSEVINSFRETAADGGGGTRSRFDLRTVVLDAVMPSRAALERIGCSLQVDVVEDIEMDSYHVELTRVLRTLLSNAVVHAFAGRDGGNVSVTGAPAGDGMVCLLVSDDGVGIPAARLGRIFDPFAGAAGQGGSGLGMHAVWHAVTAVLGGTITAASTTGRGTTFRIMLPLSAPPAAAT